MVNLTISLSEGTARRLRRVVKERFHSKKGALSGLIEEALRTYMERFETPRQLQTFRALKRSKVIAEAHALDTLARKLREMDVDPRSVRIISSARLAPVARAGFRARRA